MVKNLSHFTIRKVQDEYKRWCDIIGDDDPYASEKTLGLHDVLKAHFLIAERFIKEQKGIASIGPKDLHLLHSAVSRQVVGYGNIIKWTQPHEIAATLMYGLIQNHPFHDANKRTAFLATIFYLQTQGRIISISAEEFEDFTVLVADHGLNKYRVYRQAQKKKLPDPEIECISWFLKKNTRPIDKTHHTITFRELDTILHGFGFRLENPSGNYIDITRRTFKRTGIFSKKEVWERVGKIGFPGWSREVNKGDIRKVRQMTKLTTADHVDSKVFFKGHEPLKSLVGIYEAPLLRLADR